MNRNFGPDPMRLSFAEIGDVACRSNPGVWAEQRRGFTNADLHWEWYRLIVTQTRCAVVAPREHAKTEVFSVNQTAWRSIYQPGTWTYVFANTADQAQAIKARIDSAVSETAPALVDKARVMTVKTSQYANGSMVTAAGAGKSVRGAHPDVIIGDDVLEERTALTALQRRKMERWWLGTVGGMAHSGTTRTLFTETRHNSTRHVTMPPTRMFLIGTPFHSQDLLMNMRINPIYRFFRYAAEFDAAALTVPGSLAVEIA